MAAPSLRKVRHMTHPTGQVAFDQTHGHQNSRGSWGEFCFLLNANRFRTARQLARAVAAAVVVVARPLRRVLAFLGPGVAATVWSASGHLRSAR